MGTEGYLMHYRCCPECKRKNWLKSRSYAKITICEHGYLTTKMVSTDAMSFICNDCGYEECS